MSASIKTETVMPIYMDVHNVPGVKALDVAEAHTKDLLYQHEFACKCMTYWIDEERENIFCLIEAPSKEAVEEMHGKAHGLLPNKIIEVHPNVVSSFLGRIYDPSDAATTDDGLKVFADPSFRILLVIKITDPVLLQFKFGREKIYGLLNQHKNIIRKNLTHHGGTEVEYGGNGFIISFTSASRAVSCALAIQDEMKEYDQGATGTRIAINAGEPVEKSNTLFGDTLQLAWNMCAISSNMPIVVSNAVKELVAKDHFQTKGNNFLTMTPQNEALLGSLFGILEENWKNSEFDIDDYCQVMAMSKSQLYRKTIQLTGLSPNILLKEYRLEKAKDLMRKKHYNIAQITYDSGFTSPSYFTKCFKKKYSLLPMAYLELLH
jgi:AraC-like DNA-binding protein